MLLSIGKERKIADIPIVQIRPSRIRARQSFNDDKLKELAMSIRHNGVVQPLTVRKINMGEYELIAGERRLRAAAMCGKAKVPCVVISCTDRQADVFSLTENLQREDLNFLEEAEGIQKLIHYSGMTQQEAARKLGKRQSTIANKLRVLKLTNDEKALILKSNLTERHARALLKVENPTERKLLMCEVINQCMNVSQTEQYIESYLLRSKTQKKNRQKRTIVIKDIRIFENTIKQAVGIMRQSGIKAVSTQSESKDYIEYTIRVAKNTVLKTPQPNAPIEITRHILPQEVSSIPKRGA